MTSSLPNLVIAAFGGLTPMKTVLGHKHVTTIQGWLRSGNIPTWRWPEIAEAATRNGIELPAEALEAIATQKRQKGAA